jgi:hypothetical protein
MEGVEDIPGSALTEGISWEWESFPEFLDAIGSQPHVFDIGFQLAHGPLRGYVMGERGAANEPATAEDLVVMQRLAAAALATVAVAVPATAAAATAAGQQAAPQVLTPGDAGFTLATPSGELWLYGDSKVNGVDVRNAVTLGGKYVGTIAASRPGRWIWPGAPFLMADGSVAMYSAEFVRTGPTIWSYKPVQNVRVKFPANNAGAARVQPSAPGLIWGAASTRDAKGPIVYAVDGNRAAHAGRPHRDGSVTPLSTVGGPISSEFSVLKAPDGGWWMAGQLPDLSRQIVAYPLSSPTGAITGKPVTLMTVSDPGPTGFTYAASLHPELHGLLTWAVNGTGPNDPYGLRRIERFWPTALWIAKVRAAAGPVGEPLTATVADLTTTLDGVLSKTVGDDRMALCPGPR